MPTHVSGVKFFNFGLADFGYPELGSFSLEEMQSVRLPFGMGIERDILFATDVPISVWVEAARQAGSIRADELIVRAMTRPSGGPLMRFRRWHRSATTPAQDRPEGGNRGAMPEMRCQRGATTALRRQRRACWPARVREGLGFS